MDQIRATMAQIDQEQAELLARRAAKPGPAGAVDNGDHPVGQHWRSGRRRRHGWFITTTLTKQIGTAVGQVQSSSAELQAAANQQGDGRQGTDDRDERDHDDDQRAAGNLAPDRRKRPARGAYRRPDGNRRPQRSRDGRYGPGLDLRHSPPSRPDRRPYAGARQEIAGNRLGARHRGGALGADQHPRHQCDDRGGRRRR